MKTNNLLLVGGGFIAGYVLCKLMNRNSNLENFSADGKPSTSNATFYRWNGQGKALHRGGSANRYFILTPPNDQFALTGQSKWFKRELIVGGGGQLTPHSWEVTQSGEGIEYVETTMTKKIPSGNTTFYRSIWLPKKSVVRI